MPRPPKADAAYLWDMLKASRTAQEIAARFTREHYQSDELLRLAVERVVEIIGEAANQVSETTIGQTSAIPWADIIGMRNRLVHAYFDINLEILWKTIQDDLPPLIVALEDVLKRELAK